MSVFVNRKALCIALAGALVSATSAMAGLPDQVVKGPIRVGNPNAAACAVGFTAAPATINAANSYNQSYVCTGPTIVCSPSFKAQELDRRHDAVHKRRLRHDHLWLAGHDQGRPHGLHLRPAAGPAAVGAPAARPRRARLGPGEAGSGGLKSKATVAKRPASQ